MKLLDGEEVSKMELQKDAYFSLLWFAVPFFVIFSIILALAMNGVMDRILIFPLYVGDILGSACVLFVHRAIMTEKGNALKSLMLIVTWAINNVTPLFLFFRDPKPVAKIRCDLKAEDVKKKLESYMAKIEGKVSDKKEEKGEIKPTQTNGGEKQATLPKDFIYVYMLPLKSAYVGYDEKARINRVFQHPFLYCPGEEYAKHFPQMQSAEVPFEGAFINHGHIDFGNVECIGWTENPFTAEWRPHFVISHSTLVSKAIRTNFKLPTVNEAIMAAAAIKDMATEALGIKSDLDVATQTLDDLLSRRPKTAREHAKREKDADTEDENIIFKPESEEKTSYWKIFAALGITALLIAFITKIIGVW